VLLRTHRETASPANENSFLTVWIGRHELDRISIPREAGWSLKEIDLGLAGALNRPFFLTVELSSNAPNPTQVLFDAVVSSSEK
jgi:hypothetical protein